MSDIILSLLEMLLFYRAKKVFFQPPHLPHKGCSTNIFWVNELGFFYFFKKKFLCHPSTNCITDIFCYRCFQYLAIWGDWISKILYKYYDKQKQEHLCLVQKCWEKTSMWCVHTKMFAFLLVEALINLLLILKIDANCPQKWQTNKNSTTIIHVTKNARHI